MAEGKARASREVWAKRVERWRDSGLSAPEFARELGVNPRTLSYWKYALKRAPAPSAPKARGRRPRLIAPGAAGSSFVRIEGAATIADRFELELSKGRRLWIPASFDAATLRRLLDTLEES